MNVNKVILVGRLTRDVELRTTQTGQTVATVSVATSSNWTDKNGQKQEKAEFHNVVMWGRTAEIAGQYLSKGQLVFIEGRLQTRSYTGKDGIERKTTEVVADTMQLGPRPQGQSSGSQAPRAQQAAATGAPAAMPKPDDIPTINLDEENDEVRIEDVPF